MAVLAHYADFGRPIALIAKLLRSIDGEEHGLRLGFIGPIFLIIELDQPVIVVLNDKIPGLNHRDLLLRRLSVRDNACELYGVSQRCGDEQFGINGADRRSLDFDRHLRLASVSGRPLRGFAVEMAAGWRFPERPAAPGRACTRP